MSNNYTNSGFEPEDPVPVKRKHTARNIVLIFLAVLLVAIGVCAFLFFRKASFYKTHFFDGTVINQTDVSNMTADEAIEVLSVNKAVFAFQLTFRDNKIEIVEGEDIDYKSDISEPVKELLKQQNPNDWLKASLYGNVKEAASTTSYDVEKLREKLRSFPEMDTANMTAPQDARMEFANGKMQIVGEVMGNTLDPDVVVDAAEQAVFEDKRDLIVEEVEGAYKDPSVYMDDPELNAQAEQLNDLVSASITYLSSNGPIVLDGNTLKDWLVVDEKGQYYKNDAVWDQKCEEFVNQLADRMNNIGKDRPFDATGLGVITISGTGYGWEIDKEAELRQLKEDLSLNVVTTRFPKATRSEFSDSNYGFGGTYVEMDLSRQHLWYYRNGVLTLDTDIVSGRMIKSRYTPPGIFVMDYKQKGRVLRGEKREDGSYEYEQYVDYWMPFNGGIGMHDADWNPTFGGTRYINSGSHGCINMPSDMAAKMFEYMDTETPIIVYYSEPYTLNG